MLTKNKFNKIIATLLVLITLIGVVPINVFAHDAVLLQVVVNKSTNLFSYSIVTDNASTLSSEKKHLEAEFIDEASYSMLKDSSYKNMSSSYSTNVNDSSKDGNDGWQGFVFTFPYKEDKDSDEKNHYTSIDVDRANFIGTTLVSNLNEAIVFLNNGKNPESVDDLIEISRVLATASNGSTQTVNGKSYTISYGASGVEADTSLDPNGAIISQNDYISITNEKGKTISLLFRLEKGYKTELIADSSFYEDDVKYITFGQLIFEADYLYTQYDISTTNSLDYESMSGFEKMIVEFFEKMFTGIRSMLGLYSIGELIYNNGVRGGSTWLYGVMPNTWAERVMVFYWLMFALSLAVLLIAVILNLLKKNISTINPKARKDFLEMISDVGISGFLLVFLIPFMTTIFRFNYKLVDLFGAYSGNVSSLSEIPNYGSAIGGVLMQLFYLILAVFFNFSYIVRSVTIAILFVTAPIFVIMIAFGGKTKMGFSQWVREFVGVVFKQSIEALYFSVFLALSVGTRGIESMVIMMTCLPISQWLVRLITGTDAGVGTALNALKGVAGFAEGAKPKPSNNRTQKSSGESTNKEDKNSNSSEPQNKTNSPNVGGRNTTSGDLEKDTGITTKNSPNSGSGIDSNDTPPSINDNVKDLSKTNADVKMDEIKSSSNGDSQVRKLSSPNKVGNSMGAVKGVMSIGGKGLNTATDFMAGGAGAMLGVGTALALGGMDPSFAKMGGRMRGDALDWKRGTQSMVGNVVSKGNGAVQKMSKKISGNSDGNNPNPELKSLYNNAKFNPETGAYDQTVGGKTESVVVDPYVGYDDREDGGIDIYNDKEYLKANGIEDVYSQGKGAYSVELNPSRLTNEQKQNLSHYAQMQDIMNQEDDPKLQAQLKESFNNAGLESVKTLENGNIVLSMNSNALPSMNVEGFSNSGAYLKETKAIGKNGAQTHYVPKLDTSQFDKRQANTNSNAKQKVNA